MRKRGNDDAITASSQASIDASSASSYVAMNAECFHALFICDFDRSFYISLGGVSGQRARYSPVRKCGEV